jgi:N-acetylglucosaminyl-diphospho-decaprenol L-rhamnosyltransferase
MAPLLEVVIVAYGASDLLRSCLESLRAHPPAAGEMRVHVVDNASPDGTADMVENEFPEVALTRLERNAGFSAANNVVLRACRAPFVLLLNPDTELRGGVLDHLIGELRARPGVGMIGCRLVRPDGSFDHAAKRAFPTPVSALAHFTGLGRGGDAPAWMGQYRAPALGEHDAGRVDAVNGAFMLVRREALEDVGPLDEGYWLYMEDLDWCARFWARGWQVIYDGRVTAMHVKGGTSGARRALAQNVAFHRGMGRFYRRWQGGRRPLVDLAVYAGIAVKLGISLVRSSRAGAAR